MGGKKLTIEEKTRALTLIEQGMPVNCVAVELNVSRVSLFKLKKSAAALPVRCEQRRFGAALGVFSLILQL